jgi:hypothetical protein
MNCVNCQFSKESTISVEPKDNKARVVKQVNFIQMTKSQIFV